MLFVFPAVAPLVLVIPAMMIAVIEPLMRLAAGGSEHPTTVPMWTVADIDVAVARVREAGGTVLQEPARQPYGVSAECIDDQGGRFYLGEF